MTNAMTNEIMSMEQLDGVAGGTCKETDHIINALGYVVKTECRGRTSTRKLYRSEVRGYLKDHYGIEASLHNGFWIFSDGDPNTYKMNGKSITHLDVIKMIVGEDRLAESA